MKISKIVLYKAKGIKIPKSTKLPMPTFFYDGLYVVKVITSDGVDGFGEPSPYGAPEKIMQGLIKGQYFKSIIGQDPLNIIIGSRRGLYAGGYWLSGFHALCAGINQALLDIKGKAMGIPVFQTFALKAPGRIQAYASAGMHYEDTSRVEIIDEVLRCKSLGYSGYKFRPALPKGEKNHFERNASPPPVDVPGLLRLAADIRRSVGPDMALMLDAGGRLSYEEAIVVIKELGELDFKFIEEPIARSSRKYKALVSKAQIDIAAGEDSIDFLQLKKWVTRGGVAVVQPDTNLCSVNDLVSIDPFLRSRGIDLVMHSWTGGISSFSNAHLGVSLESCSLIEQSVIENPLRDALILNPLIPYNGWIELSNEPGLGCCLDCEFLEKNKKFSIEV